MTALGADRVMSRLGDEPIPSLGEGPVGASVTIYKGALLAYNSAGYLVPATTAVGLRIAGVASEKVVNAGANGAKRVKFERGVFPFENSSSGDAIAETDVGQDCFVVDDTTVAKTNGSGTRSVAGRIESFDGGKPWVRILGTVGAAPYVITSLPAFAAADSAPTTIINGAIYDVPTTAANSTVTLPTAASDGTVATFVADGTKNGHTVQYRDQAGTTVITAALTASKRHMVTASKVGGKWFAIAHVSP
jgi:hypothetical protein